MIKLPMAHSRLKKENQLLRESLQKRAKIKIILLRPHLNPWLRRPTKPKLKVTKKVQLML